MPALRIATGIILGVVNLTPMGRLLSTGVMGVADAASHGKASEFANNGHQVNGTLSMLPGGMLAQQVANDASNGKSGDTLSKYVPDPKKMVIHDVVKIGETVVTHPKSTLGVIHDLSHNDGDSLKNIGNNYTKTAGPITHHIGSHKPTIPHTIVNIPSQISDVKPSIFKSIVPARVEQTVSTLSFATPVLSQKPSIFTTITHIIKPSVPQRDIPQSVLTPPSTTPLILPLTLPTTLSPTLPPSVSSTMPQVVTSTSASTIPQVVTSISTSTLPAATTNMSTLGISTPISNTQIATPPPLPLMAGVGAVCLACFMLL